VQSYAERVLGDDAFLASVRAFVEQIGIHAALDGLGGVLLRATCPGVPDTYQGAELWNHALVDPDNRGPVDFDLRRRLLEECNPAAIPRLLERWQDGAIKLFVLRSALAIRRTHAEVLRQGSYESIFAGEHVVAFARATERRRLVVCIPRLSVKLARGRWPIGDVWGKRRIGVPGGEYRDAFTGRVVVSNGEVELDKLFATFPLSLLVSHG
jgi:(1->4)-alpha-D-glucan 1-alpha-D-glucosylmutase